MEPLVSMYHCNGLGGMDYLPSHCWKVKFGLVCIKYVSREMKCKRESLFIMMGCCFQEQHSLFDSKYEHYSTFYTAHVHKCLEICPESKKPNFLYYTEVFIYIYLNIYLQDCIFIGGIIQYSRIFHLFETGITVGRHLGLLLQKSKKLI